jgi:alpha-L-fucosidase 2
MRLPKNFFSLLLFFIASITRAQTYKPVELWYTQPAKEWSSEALPIGNGRMGAMFFGGVEKEVIQFNEQSLWSGDNNWDGEYETGDHGFGSYRNFGEIVIHFANRDEAKDYQRKLDLETGVHTTSYIQNGIIFSREAFASFPDQVMVFRYSSSKKGSFSGKISLHSAQGAKTTSTNNSLYFNCEMPNKLKYAAVIHFQYDGGKTRVEGDSLVFEKCNSITLLVNARTNYKADFNSGWRGADPLPVIEKELKTAGYLTYKKLLDNHLNDITKLSKAAHIDIGNSETSVLALPTDERLKKYSSGGKDPDLEEIMFQYGRYLLVSCSRPGGLPANLQGLWNNSNTPPWASDYHSNINLQMNYWLAESTNLSECHKPLIDFIDACRPSCQIATKKAFGETTRGWTTRTSQSIFGGNGWEWNIPASAWYAQHVYEHWAFTNDKEYLKLTAYPILKEICEFWQDRLKRMPDGTLMAPDGWSPEHGPREDGIMHDQQIIWDLFQNYLEMARALQIDTSFQTEVVEMQAKLAPNKIGKWGQLQEWHEDRDDPNDQHRHTSHLFAVYPGRQISITKTPEFADAAILSLRSRSGNYGINVKTPFTVESTVGDSRRSWTWPWRCALWARLGEGERAGIMIRGLLTYNTLPNLFCDHPPFQMDGNFGIPAAMAEMLLQSHEGEIQLLPAIPAEWAAKGSFTGLKARGGFTVDCLWLNGKVISYKIKSAKPVKVKVRVNGEVVDILSNSL